MATDALSVQELARLEADSRARTLASRSSLAGLLLPLASLKLTVVLFAAAIFLIFAGTLAQVKLDIWEVLAQYFRTWFAWIELQIFFPPAFFTGEPPHVPGGFWFPGGKLIGGAMFVNLLAAHALRFKAQAKGARLAAGLAVIALGVTLTWMVIVGGSGKDTIESAAPFEWSALWIVMKWSLAAIWLSTAYALFSLAPEQKIERFALGASVVLLGGLVLWLFYAGQSAALGDSSLRILWQLIKGGLAGLVLLAGCILVFRKRAGIVLLHAGIALVMANEFVVSTLHVESRMQLVEGESRNYVEDDRTVELAVVDTSNAATDEVVVVPRSLLRSRQNVSDPNLPFDIKVVDYFANAGLAQVKAGDANPATAGIGLRLLAFDERGAAGTDVAAKVDRAGAYVQLTDKRDKQPLGTYLVGVGLNEQQIEVDGKTYDLALRFKRTYKPYWITLNDFRFDKYLGTQTPKNYSSDLRLVDEGRGVDRDVHIWMNNPLRFAGETFYQQSFFEDRGREGTVLQVVTNTGWMIPYVACMLVATGMLAQFSTTLVRFLRRRESPKRRRSIPNCVASRWPRPPIANAAARWVPLGLVVACAGWILSSAVVPKTPLNEMQLEEFGRLPVVQDGRVKPLDTLAHNTLRYLSNYQTLVDDKGKTTGSAIQWLLDVVARPRESIKQPVFRVDSLEVLETLKLKPRKGFRYSIAEMADGLEELERQAKLAAQVDPKQLTPYQKKVLELDKRLNMWRLMRLSFDAPEIRRDHVQEDVGLAMQQVAAMEKLQPPLAIPPETPDGKWQSYLAAWFDELRAIARGATPNPATAAFGEILDAYGGQDATAFNRALAKYELLLAEKPPADYQPAKVNYEAFVSFFNPFYGAMALYVLAFLLVVGSWLGWTSALSRASIAVILLALVVHTFALVSRIYISGRPPVTNLYSSAVFIGWGCVLLGLLMEWIFRLGIGTVIASVAGFTTLLIANFLAGLTDGDTLGVLQAVLDTQFWLATHVVCVTMGYATTYFAGLLGVLYILRGVLTPSLTPAIGKDFSRMIYGTLCFAMFFSFVGTVLGGLWADDSWGRFWGWDPKENGALIIVLWNALVLHARWGGLVKERGLAALAVGGNIVTSWSWFGVNELGEGLHSYGFTEGVLLALGLFVLSQLAIIGLAAVPTKNWLSNRAPRLA